MKICNKCGQEIDDSAIFCQYCGEAQKEKKESKFKKLVKFVKNYVVEEPKTENSLIKFMVSSMNLAFILLIVYSVLCGLYDFLGLFVYLQYSAFVDFIVAIPSIIGAIIIIVVSLRAIKEITKLGQQAIIDEKSKDILIKIYSGGIVFIGLVFLVLLN